MPEDKKQVLEGLVTICAPLGAVAGKPMFGGIGVFCEGLMFALITRQGELYLKADDENRADFESLGQKKFGKMPYYLAPDDVRGSWQTFEPWAEGAVAASRRAAKGKGVPRSKKNR